MIPLTPLQSTHGTSFFYPHYTVEGTEAWMGHQTYLPEDLTPDPQPVNALN